MPLHLTKLETGAVVPSAAGMEDGYPFLETTNGRLYYASSEVYERVASTGRLGVVSYGADHSVVAGDLGLRVRFTATAILTLPSNATTALALNVVTQVFVQTGTLTVAAGAGATVVNNTGPYTVGTTIHLVKDATDTWVIY